VFVPLGLLCCSAHAQEAGQEIVANLSAGRVVIYVAKDGMVIAANESRLEADSRPPLVAQLSPKRIAILLGAAEWVLPGTGRTFPPGDVETLAACLRPLLADAGLRARLGQGALDRIRQWSHAGSPETIVRALEFATGGRGRAGLR